MTGALSEHLDDLLAGEAAGDLDAAERAELAGIQRRATPDNDLMRVAALAQLAFLQAEKAQPKHMPPALEARLAAQASSWSAGGSQAGPRRIGDLDAARRQRAERQPAAPAARAASRSDRTGWLVAAGLALALGLSWLRPAATPPQPDATSLTAQRDSLLQAPDAIRIPWGRSAQPGYEAVTGDVVWSAARQAGYLRLVGLPPNDPAATQYQLWIVAPDRDAHPVDGGVFDVGQNGEVIVRIDPKLRVDRAAAFAITLEKPGGVVVSSQPLLLVAAT